MALARGRGLGNSKGPVTGRNSISSGTSKEAGVTGARDHGGAGVHGPRAA